MTETEALEILGLSRPTTADEVRAACRERIDDLRAEIRSSREAPDWSAFEARLAALMQAQQCLLTGGDAMAKTQRLPRIKLRRLGLGHGVALLIGLLALFAGLSPFVIQSDAPQVAEPALQASSSSIRAIDLPPVFRKAAPIVARVQTDGATASAASPAARLAELRELFHARWAGAEQVPARIDLLAVILPDAGPGWRWQAQADGLFALVEEASGQWLLAVPLIGERGELGWVCLSSTAAHPGCHAPDLPLSIGRRVVAGELDILRLARGIEALPELAGLPETQRWMYQAVRQDYPEAALWLADALAALGDPEADRWYAWAFDGFFRREEALDATAVASTLARRRAVVSRNDAIAWIQRCRQVVAQMEAGRCVTPGELGMAAEREERFGDARWWYEQGSKEREALAATGLVRALALGRGGSHEPWNALRLLEEAWMGLDDLSRLDAARIAGQIGRIYAEGWGVEPDPAEAAWWASHGGRLGDPEAALDLAVAFAVGAGIPRNPERAEQVLQRYRSQEPLLDVRFERRLGRRLEVGLDGQADPEAAARQYRRAWETCFELAESGMVIAQLELAEMTLEGIGVEASKAGAAKRFEALLEDEPVRAGARLAWILATAEDSGLRDPERALTLARKVVGQEQSPEHFETLAAALAANGRWEEASDTQRLAIEALRESAMPLAWGDDIRAAEQRMLAGLERYRAQASVAERAGALPEFGALRVP